MTSIAKIGESICKLYKTTKTHTDSHDRTYRVMEGKNGYSFVNPADVAPIFHATDGNEKTGRAGNYNLPVEMTCDHRCECYRTGDCYACGHCYSFPSNQADYAENLNFYRMSDDETFIQTVVYFIRKDRLHLYRWFTCGDIPDSRFLRCMVEIARRCPDVEFWAYTKKYSIVNAYLDTVSGVLPENLCVIFSHWMNRDGSYFPMSNPYSLPTSEFIPVGREDIESGITHVCPCSDPDSIATCETCDRPCYRLKRGESMGLREHSTKASKTRDDSLKASKNAIKATKKAEKKGGKKAK